MTETETIRLFKCLADKSRLQILKSLAVEDMYVERLAERLGLTASTISFHLKKLSEANAVTAYKNQYYTMYALNKEIFQTRILEILNQESDEAQKQAQRDAAYRQKVIDSFFEYGKLKSIPAQLKKERIVLDVIIQTFAFGKTYSEREVNILLADFYDDFCTLRRDMVDEKLLGRSRDGKEYWRIKKTERSRYPMNSSDLPTRLDRKTIYESDYVCLYTDKVQLSDGAVIEKYHQIHYPHEAVSIVVFNEKGEVLLIQSKRYTVMRLEWEIPAGRMEAGESKEEAARRECREETGCTVKDLKFLCSQNPSNGMSDCLCHVFAARVDTESANFDANEVKTKQWIPKEKVLEMLKNNETKDGVSILALLFAFAFYQ